MVELLKSIIKHFLRLKVEGSWLLRSLYRARPHALGAPLIVSLTSFPARFAALPLTLKCLLTQSIRPDRTILWISESDVPSLTPEILKFQSLGLEIRTCAEMRSYAKIIPALQAFPDAFIVTADDDMYYWPRWLETLAQAFDPNVREVICHRAHRIRVSPAGLPLPYTEWEQNIGPAAGTAQIFPTGVGGVLYAPGILPRDTLDRETFMTLSPTADDIWLYYMAGINGATYRKIGRRHYIVTWPGTQKVSLRQTNVPAGGGNDLQLKKMMEHYGFPPVAQPERIESVT
jgi:hypothetical protein